MAGDIMGERSALFLGSRLRRLAERMQGDVIRFAATVGLDVQPGQYSLLATLERWGPQTIGELTTAMALSQPAITRMVAKLGDMGLVSIDRLHKDQRHKTVTLTPAGLDNLERAKLYVWPEVEAAVNDMVAGLDGPLFDQIAALERRLEETPLDQRAKSRAPTGLTLHDYSDALAKDFNTISTEWISATYTLEPTDIEVLENPRAKIIDPGGDILFVEAEGLGVIGAGALQKTGENQFELIKMGVLEKARGRGAGEFLLRALIARAERRGAKRLYLLSNRKSAAAIRLYERHGFHHDEGIMQEFGARYARCDVAMLYRG